MYTVLLMRNLEVSCIIIVFVQNINSINCMCKLNHGILAKTQARVQKFKTGVKYRLNCIIWKGAKNRSSKLKGANVSKEGRYDIN